MSQCPDSLQVKGYFKSKSIEFKYVDIDTFGDQGQEIHRKLQEKTGESNKPSVWVNGKFIGE
jgi:glutaredoxin